MSAVRSGKSHAMAWALALIVGLPVLYLLSCPFILQWGAYRDAGESCRISQKWLIQYYAPYHWAASTRAFGLGTVLENYEEWAARTELKVERFLRPPRP
jgi:hypothetical protein